MVPLTIMPWSLFLNFSAGYFLIWLPTFVAINSVLLYFLGLAVQLLIRKLSKNQKAGIV